MAKRRLRGVQREQFRWPGDALHGVATKADEGEGRTAVAACGFPDGIGIGSGIGHGITLRPGQLDSRGSRGLAHPQGCSNATVNRTLALVRAILRKCVNEWEWLERAPQIRMLREPTRRIRSLTHEARRLLAELPEHLADMAAFSLATGLRAANVTGLQWQQVDLTRQLAWVHPRPAYTLKRKCMTSPSLTTYSRPSSRILPASFAPCSPWQLM